MWQNHRDVYMDDIKYMHTRIRHGDNYIGQRWSINPLQKQPSSVQQQQQLLLQAVALPKTPSHLMIE